MIKYLDDEYTTEDFLLKMKKEYMYFDWDTVPNTVQKAKLLTFKDWDLPYDFRFFMLDDWIEYVQQLPPNSLSSLQI
jgi:hypothetical protein